MTLQEIIDEFTSPLNKGTEEEKLKKIRSQVEELPFEAEPLDSEVIRLEQQIKELEELLKIYSDKDYKQPISASEWRKMHERKNKH